MLSHLRILFLLNNKLSLYLATLLISPLKTWKMLKNQEVSFFPETIAPHAVIKATQVATFDKTNKAAERNSHDNQQVDQLRYNLPVPAES